MNERENREQTADWFARFSFGWGLLLLALIAALLMALIL